MKFLVLVALALSLVACAPFAPSAKQTRRYYSVSLNACEGSIALPQALVQVHGASFYDTQRIVYSRADRERQYYSFAMYTERPFELLERALNRRAAGAERISLPVVELYIDELFHDAGEEPGAFVLRGTVRGASLQAADFAISEPVEMYTAEGAVRAFERSICQLAAFMAQVLHRASPSAGLSNEAAS